MTCSPVVIGLDLSLTGTGIADHKGVTSTVVTTSKQPIGKRLELIHDAIRQKLVLADLVVIEDLPTHAHAAGLTGKVHGVAHLACWHAQVPVLTITPATLKKYATGRGNADKTAMAIAALKRSGREFASDDECDAWWLRLAGLDLLGHPAVVLPQTQRDALAKLTLPTEVPA